MTRKTSIETYRQIESEGLLSRRRLQVYQTLYKIGPATAAEISQEDQGSFTNPAKGDNSHARLSELMKMGCVEEVGTKACSITGRNVILYDVTSDIPKPYKAVKKESKSQILDDLMAELIALKNKPILAEIKVRELNLLINTFSERIDQKS